MIQDNQNYPVAIQNISGTAVKCRIYCLNQNMSHFRVIIFRLKDFHRGWRGEGCPDNVKLCLLCMFVACMFQALRSGECLENLCWGWNVLTDSRERCFLFLVVVGVVTVVCCCCIWRCCCCCGFCCDFEVSYT